MTYYAKRETPKNNNKMVNHPSLLDYHRNHTDCNWPLLVANQPEVVSSSQAPFVAYGSSWCLLLVATSGWFAPRRDPWISWGSHLYGCELPRNSGAIAHSVITTRNTPRGHPFARIRWCGCTVAVVSYRRGVYWQTSTVRFCCFVREFILSS